MANDAGSPRVAGVVLAAGLSRRFGANKLLAELDGVALVRRAVEAARASRLDPIVVVLGHEHARVRAAIESLLEAPRLRVVVNPEYAAGQSTSVVCGLEAVAAGSDATLFLMGDQPRLGAAIIDALIAAFATGGHLICHPSIGGQRRTPVLFARALYPEILALAGDVGARGIIDAHRDHARALEWPDAAPFMDVDEISDLAASQRLRG